MFALAAELSGCHRYSMYYIFICPDCTYLIESSIFVLQDFAATRVDASHPPGSVLSCSVRRQQLENESSASLVISRLV